jgi:hypothetical protein
MAASIDRLLQRLGSASDPGALLDLVGELLDAISESQDRDAAAAALASRLVASPGALEQLAQLLHQQHAGTVGLVGTVLMKAKQDDGRRLASSLAAAPRPVAEALVGVLGSSTADTATKAHAGFLLFMMAQQSQPCARQAASAGVFVHLAALLKQRPAEHGEAFSSLLLLVSVKLCMGLVAGSANRAQLAMQQGVLEALPALLGEGYSTIVQERAAVALCTLLDAAPQMPSSQLAARIIGGLVRLLARRPAARQQPLAPEVADWTLHTLAQLLTSATETREQVVNAVAGNRGALMALVGLTRRDTEDQQQAGLDTGPGSRVEAMVLLRLVLCGHPQQIEAAFEAGLPDALPHCLGPQAIADDRMLASDTVRGLEAALSGLAASGDQGASRRLGQLRAVMAQCPLVGDEQVRDRAATALMAEDQCRAGECAKCGARAGQPGVRLQMCSRCKRVCYCGPQCQRAHWRAHKAQCRK